MQKHGSPDCDLNNKKKKHKPVYTVTTHAHTYHCWYLDYACTPHRLTPVCSSLQEDPPRLRSNHCQSGRSRARLSAHLWRGRLRGSKSVSLILPFSQPTRACSRYYASLFLRLSKGSRREETFGFVHPRRVLKDKWARSSFRWLELL